MTRILILGAGYAGLAFACEFLRRPAAGVEVTLVDRNPYHTLLTETHTVAAGSRRKGSVAVPLALLTRRFPALRLVTAAITGADAKAQVVHTTAGPLRYDSLIFALGGADPDYGIPGVREHALTLRGLDDALRIRAALAALPPGAGVVVVGGGLTGVELAAEMAWNGRGKGHPITLVEAAPVLLPGLPPALQHRALHRLKGLGVEVRTGNPVQTVRSGEVVLASGGAVPFGLLIWAAGVRGHPLLGALDIALGRDGRAQVDEHLRSSRPDIYVVGDSAAFAPAPGAPALPPSAQLAGQMGQAAARDLAARLSGRPGIAFRPRLAGVICDLGGASTTGLVYGLPVGGWIGAMAKRVALLRHLWRTFGWAGLRIGLTLPTRRCRWKRTPTPPPRPRCARVPTGGPTRTGPPAQPPAGPG